jgi:thiosulfate dehydrogenase [quinone] large subunit
MSRDAVERGLVVFLRVAIGWTFLWAGVRQVFITPDFSVASFLSHTKTFHDVFSVFMVPSLVGITSFLVKWGHLLIGLSLVSGLLVRISGTFGMLLMGMYYFAHMDFPYIEAQTNLLVDYHLVYIAVIAYLIQRRAGHVWGLDGLVEKMSFVAHRPRLAPLVH